MDYIALFADAVLTFFKNLDISAIVAAFADIDWNGIKDAIISVVESLIKTVG